MLLLHRSIAAACGLLALTATTLAHEGATGVAKERMDLMGDMSQHMKEISKRLNANRDLKAIAVDADHITQVAPHIPDLFPKGSDNGITDAKPVIWEQWAEFLADVKKLSDESAALASVASSGDPKAISNQYRTLAKACIACHDTYRRGRADRL